MNRRDVVKAGLALSLLTLPGWVPAKKSPAIYADGRYIPVAYVNRDELLIVLAEPLRGHTVFRAERAWDDKLDKVNLTPLTEKL